MDELALLVHERKGLFIPAHIDRAAFSVKSQLGFLPDGDWDAVEVMHRPCDLNGGRYFEITGSDAHYPENVGQRAFELDLPSEDFEGLKKFLVQ
ncbi:MAG: PHP-associated domain-containing protein [Spirochaetales bacterium]|nr:PHP-associated domain-containing protein [Spirochaetales bacterium]